MKAQAIISRKNFQMSLNPPVRLLRNFWPLFKHETPACLSFVTLALIDPSTIFLNSQIIFKI